MFKEFLGKYAMTCEFTTRRLPRSSSPPDVLPQTIRADSPSLTQMCSFETKEDEKIHMFFKKHNLTFNPTSHEKN